MAWIYLIIAGALEVGWMLTMKYSEGFTRLWWSLLTLGTGTASFLILSLSLKSIPIGTAYAVWTGIGAVGAAIMGILFFNESREFMRLVSIALIVARIVGLKLSHAG